MTRSVRGSDPSGRVPAERGRKPSQKIQPPFAGYQPYILPRQQTLLQSILAVLVGIASVAALLWAGARIFRVGVLMQGKTPTPRELLRWIWMR